MNLEKLDFVELTEQELKEINGGSWIGRAWNWLKRSIGIGGREGEIYAEISINI